MSGWAPLFQLLVSVMATAVNPRLHVFTYHWANGTFNAYQADGKLMTQPLMEPFMLLCLQATRKTLRKMVEGSSGANSGSCRGACHDPPTPPTESAYDGFQFFKSRPGLQHRLIGEFKCHSSHMSDLVFKLISLCFNPICAYYPLLPFLLLALAAACLCGWWIRGNKESREMLWVIILIENEDISAFSFCKHLRNTVHLWVILLCPQALG